MWCHQKLKRSQEKGKGTFSLKRYGKVNRSKDDCQRVVYFSSRSSRLQK